MASNAFNPTDIQAIPHEVGILPLRNTVAYPYMVIKTYLNWLLALPWHTRSEDCLDVDFDLREVMFITTANQLETILPPLRDRMEVIALDGYTEYEKLHIATNHLVPRQIKVNGLRPQEIAFDTPALSIRNQG